MDVIDKTVKKLPVEGIIPLIEELQHYLKVGIYNFQPKLNLNAVTLGSRNNQSISRKVAQVSA
jgi:hypothetical protein